MICGSTASDEAVAQYDGQFPRGRLGEEFEDVQSPASAN